MIALNQLDGHAIGKCVLHRVLFEEFEGVVVAETDSEVKLKYGIWPFKKCVWVSRVGTLEVRR